MMPQDFRSARGQIDDRLMRPGAIWSVRRG